MLDLILGGSAKFYAVIVGLATIVTGFVVAWRHTYNSGKNAKEVEHAKARAKNLEKIRDAVRAKPRGSVHDDPHNRDNG
jgi:GH24 family phage-related lysozyme (muramidase)